MFNNRKKSNGTTAVAEPVPSYPNARGVRQADLVNGGNFENYQYWRAPGGLEFVEVPTESEETEDGRRTIELRGDDRHRSMYFDQLAEGEIEIRRRRAARADYIRAHPERRELRLSPPQGHKRLSDWGPRMLARPEAAFAVEGGRLLVAGDRPPGWPHDPARAAEVERQLIGLITGTRVKCVFGACGADAEQIVGWTAVSVCDAHADAVIRPASEPTDKELAPLIAEQIPA